MADEVKFRWLDAKEPLPEIYSNYVHTTWSLFDVRFVLGMLVPAGEEMNEGFRVERRGAVTIAWPQAKALRDLLTALIESYEKTNGEIKPPKLTPPPELPVPAPNSPIAQR